MSSRKMAATINLSNEHPLANKRIGVIGSGIVGLTTALCLQEAGGQVEIYATTKPGDEGWNSNEAALQMASAAAGASWKPYHLDFPDSRMRDHVLRYSWDWFHQLLRPTFPGLHIMCHYEASDIQPIDIESKAYYLNIVGQYGTWPKGEAPASAPSPVPGNYPYAIWYDTLHFDVATFLPALARRFEENGGKFIKLDKEFSSPSEVAALDKDAAIACVGRGARELFHDSSVHPLTGEALVIKGAVTFSNRERPYSISAQTVQTGNKAYLANQYAYPHPQTGTTIVGGTNYPGHLEHVRPEAEAYIRQGLERNLGQRIEAAAQVTARVGIRPERTGGVLVAVNEAYTTANGPIVIMNYGHGGAGYTTAPGTANIALNLLVQRLERR